MVPDPIRSSFGLPSAFRLATRLGALLGLSLLLAVFARQAEAADSAEAFMRQFTQEGLTVLSDRELSPQDRGKAVRGLLVSHFDLALTGRFVLGKHWRRASKAQRQEYLGLFESFVTALTMRRLEAYAGETIEIGRGSMTGERTARVPSRILRPEGEPIAVDWRLRRSGEGWRIVDIAVEGVSLALTHRHQFDGVIRGNGGIPALLAKLREATAGNPAASEAPSTAASAGSSS